MTNDFELAAVDPSGSAGITATGTPAQPMRKEDRRCKCCGDPKPLAEFRVVGPPGCRRRLSTCKGCQKRMGLGAACHPRPL